MTVEELGGFQEQLDRGKLLDAPQCAVLLAEVWRLKTANTAKAMEARVAREDFRQAETALNGLRAENEALRLEIEQLKAVHGLPMCELEARWSNCAVRKKKDANGWTQPAESDPANGA